MNVTVFGGNGLLGRHLTPLLAAAGHDVTIATRNPAGPSQVRSDFLTGDGLADAVRDADVVVHLVSDATKARKIDLAGTELLLSTIGPQHLVYMSIVGVDRHPFAYYRTKFEVEQLIAASGVSHTILRATQFHDFVAYFLGVACRPPVALIPKRFAFQPIEVTEVAAALSELATTRPHGLQPDLAGPAIHTAEYLARSLMTAKGRERPVVNLPVPGRAARAFREGVHTNPDRAVGQKTWEEYLEQFRGR